MNDLIDSNSSRGKVAHFETSYQMICILCGEVKHHVITEPKKQISANYWPISFKILPDLKGLELNMPNEFRSD